MVVPEPRKRGEFGGGYQYVNVVALRKASVVPSPASRVVVMADYRSGERRTLESCDCQRFYMYLVVIMGSLYCYCRHKFTEAVLERPLM
jgi:hypothetical protein